MAAPAVGVDWSSGAWVAVAYEAPDPPNVAVFDTIEGLWSTYGESARRIVVDVPIGLCTSLEHEECGCVETDGELSRRCDDLARRVVGPRSSSVFTPPAREAVKKASAGVDYSTVNELNRRLTGKGLMQQAANIASGILEVETLLLSHGDQGTILEGHPEVCFCALNGAPLEHSKKTAPGVVERLAVLDSVDEYEPGTWRWCAEELSGESQRVQLDDLLDAFVLALTACASEDEFYRLPSAPPPVDEKGLPMQIVYRRGDPFPLVKE